MSRSFGKLRGMLSVVGLTVSFFALHQDGASGQAIPTDIVWHFGTGG